MTPEELNRTIEFIAQSQARLAAGQEQDREVRLAFEKWSKNVISELALNHQRITELLQNSSGRLERSEERLERAEREDQAAQKRHEELLREMRAGFDQILEKLSKPN